MVALTAAGVAGLAAGAGAALADGGQWVTQVKTLSTPPSANATFTQVAMAANGTVAAVWQQNDGSNNYVYGSVRSPGGGVGMLGPISAASQAGDLTSPHVAIDDSGEAIAVWQFTDPKTMVSSIQWALTTPGGGWGQAFTVTSSTSGNTVGDPVVAMDANGDFTIVWDRYTSTDGAIEAASGSTRNGIGSLQQVTAATGAHARYPDVALDARGDAFASWTEQGATRFLYGDTGPAGTFVKDGTKLSGSGDNVLGGRIAVDGNGDALVVARLTGSPYALDYYTRRASSGIWTAHPLDAGNIQDFAVAASAIGLQGVIYSKFDNGSLRENFALADRDGALSSPQEISQISQDTDNPAIAFNAHGDAIVSWTRSGGVIQSATMPLGSAGFSAPLDVSPLSGGTADDSSIALDAHGDAVAAWTFNDGTYTHAQYRGYDNGPVLSNLSIPANGMAGTPLRFSAQATDVWEPVTSVGWIFRDGATASTATATHAYSTPGTYRPIVIASDDLGLSAAATSPLVVAQRSGGSGGGPAGGGGTMSRLLSFSMQRTLFATGRTPRGHTARPLHTKHGSAFLYSLSGPARVSIAVYSVQRGHRSHRQCHAGSGPRRARRCTRLTLIGTLTTNSPAGRDRLTFDGTIGGVELTPGRYLASARLAGQRGARSVRFRIVNG